MAKKYNSLVKEQGPSPTLGFLKGTSWPPERIRVLELYLCLKMLGRTFLGADCSVCKLRVYIQKTRICPNDQNHII